MVCLFAVEVFCTVLVCSSQALCLVYSMACSWQKQAGAGVKQRRVYKVLGPREQGSPPSLHKANSRAYASPPSMGTQLTPRAHLEQLCATAGWNRNTRSSRTHSRVLRRQERLCELRALCADGRKSSHSQHKRDGHSTPHAAGCFCTGSETS